MTKNLLQLKAELQRLTAPWSVNTDPRVRAAIDAVLSERKPQIDALQKQIAELQAKRPAKKARWPENTPPAVLKACETYWRGTEAFRKFRIHMWNDQAVVTSYPGGKWYDNGGGHYGQARYELIPLVVKGRLEGSLKSWSGRVSTKELQAALDAVKTI